MLLSAHTLVIRHRKIKHEMGGILFPAAQLTLCMKGLCRILSEKSCCQRNSAVDPACYWTHWPDRKYPLVPCQQVGIVDGKCPLWLDLRLSPQERTHIWCTNLKRIPGLGKGDSSAQVFLLLNGQDIPQSYHLHNQVHTHRLLLPSVWVRDVPLLQWAIGTRLIHSWSNTENKRR